MYVYKSVAEYKVFRWRHKAALWSREGKPRVSPCEPLCAIFLRKPSVYPLSPVKANVGRLCERLKNAMKCGLEQHYGGNFLAIVAGTILSEKLNFLSRIFGR